MKKLTFLLIAIIALPPIRATESWIRVGNRDINVITEDTTDTPKSCHATLLERLKKQGWHDEIYNSVADDKAFLVYSQRVLERGELSKIKITFWKANKEPDGKTKVESQVYLIAKGDVNSFLEEEIRPLFLKFSRPH